MRIWVKLLAITMAVQVMAILCPSLASAQGAIASGQTLTGAITPVGNADSWTFSANTGDAIVIRVGQITQTGSFTPRIRLFSPSSALLATAAGALAAEIVTTAAASGTFTVIVDDAVGTTATGTYRLTLAKTGSPVVVSVGDEGGPLTNGLMHTGTIDVGDVDVWTVAATAGEGIVVRMGEITAGSALTPWVRIYSPTGALVGSSAAGVAAEVAVTAASSGTYLVVVADGTANLVGSGAYRLTLAKTGSPVAVSPGDEGGPLTDGAIQTGTIDLGDLDVWTFTANAGEGIVVRMGETTAGSALTPWLRIYSPTGALLGSSAAGAAAEVAVTAPSTGTYLVVAADGTANLVGSGAYRLTLAKTGAPVVVSPGDEGGPLTNGVMHTGTIDVGDLDVWTFTANAGEGIVVRMGETTAGSALTPWVRVYSPTGALLGSSAAGAAAEVAVTAPASGTYLVVVADGTANLVGSGAYRLTLAKTGAPVVVSPGDEGGPLTNGVMHTGTIDVGDLDAWTFTANAGEGIVVRMGETTAGSALTPWVRVYSPTGALLGSSAAGAAAEVAVTAPASGTYLVVVADGTANLVGSGAYRLTLAKTGAPVVVSPGDEGGPLTNGAMHTGTIDVGDLDAWTFTANVGEGIVVRMGEVTAGSALTPWVRVYSPTGALLGSSAAGAAAEVAVTAPASGTYLVVVADGTANLVGSGAYRLTLAKTGAPVVVSPGDEGGPLTNGATQTGTIDLGDLDAWTLTANSGDAIVVTMDEVTSGGPLTPWLRIFGPSGTLLGSNASGSTAQLSITAPSSGTYLVVAADGTANLVGSGAYRLTKNAGTSANANLSDLVLSAGTLSPPFATDTLGYTANVVGSTNTITVTPTLADPTATVKVNGVTVANSTPSGPITLNVGSNLINVLVIAQNGVTTRTYTVNVTFALGVGAPMVTTNAATGIGPTGATLNGTVSSNGASTTVSFQYGTTAGYGSSAAATQGPLPPEATSWPVSASIAGLSCNTLYHFRAVATNSAGTTNGSDATFTTPTCVLLNVALAGNGSGDVTSNPLVVMCGLTCSAAYPIGAVVPLIATPDAGSVFNGWAGACIGTSLCSVSMTAPRNVTATFNSSGAGSANSNEWVQKAYVAYYGRPADPAGLGYWAGRMDAEGGSLSSIIAAFGFSDEFTRRYGGLSYSELLDKLYQQTLGRAPDPIGKQYYIDQLNAGLTTLQTITLDLLGGATGLDVLTVANRLDVANHYTGKVAAGCAYGDEVTGVASLTPVTSDWATVWTAKLQIESRCTP